jgi:hypothetical protein
MGKSSLRPKSEPDLLSDLRSLRVAYRELLEAQLSAASRKGASNPGLVSWPDLREKGVAESAIHVMLYQGHIEVFESSSGAGGERNVPVKVETVIIGESLAFALTDAGKEFAIKVGRASAHPERELYAPYLMLIRRKRLKPHYDKESRILTWGRHMLKQFRQPAENQDLLLEAFEEQGWTDWMDDPLPRVSQMNPKTRLHDTIKRLNHFQRPYLIHFKSQGGRRVGWEYH